MEIAKVRQEGRIKKVTVAKDSSLSVGDFVELIKVHSQIPDSNSKNLGSDATG